METKNALDQLLEIHTHLAKSEVFRGYRATQTMCIGIAALVFAFIQAHFLKPHDAISFVKSWIIVGTIIVVWVGSSLLYQYIANENNLKRYQTIIVARQFLPSLVAGFIMTFIMISIGEQGVIFLPGMWSILFGLGLFSMLPYMPKPVGGVGIFYLVAGSLLIYMVRMGMSLSPWGMGLTFGLGNVTSSLILYLNLERKTDHE